MKTWKIEELNGDSTVLEIKYTHGIATCIFEDYSLEKRFKIEIKTDIFYSDKNFEKESVHIEIIELGKYMLINKPSGIYILPKDFGKQMKLVRHGFHLALGKNQKEYPYFLKIKGYNTLLACPIRSTEDVKVTLIE